jgi:hypothetical protein
MMSVNFEIIKSDDRIFFNDGKKYVLFDSGFFKGMGNNSISADGMIGPFNVTKSNFAENFINLTIDGKPVSAIFNPMDGFDCQLKGNTLTIWNHATTMPEHEYFFEFCAPSLPILEGCINGKKRRLFFDSGARMTMFGERAFAAEKIRTYTEYMAMNGTYEELEVYKLQLTFPNGFSYEGDGALVENPMYLTAARCMGIDAMLGIDIFNSYDLFIAAKGAKRGIALLKKSSCVSR